MLGALEHAWRTRVEHQPERLVTLAQPLAQRLRGLDLGHRGAAALLAGAHRHRLPVGQLLCLTLALEAHIAVLGVQRSDRGDAELHRLLDGVVHAIALGDRLPEMDGQGRFALTIAHFEYVNAYFLAIGLGDVGTGFATLTVEQHQGITGLEPQHAPHMSRGSFGQNDVAAGDKRGGDVDAGALEGGVAHQWAVGACSPWAVP